MGGWPIRLQSWRGKGPRLPGHTFQKSHNLHSPLVSLQPDLEKSTQTVPGARHPQTWEEKEPPGVPVQAAGKRFLLQAQLLQSATGPALCANKQ